MPHFQVAAYPPTYLPYLRIELSHDHGDFAFVLMVLS